MSDVLERVEKALEKIASGGMAYFQYENIAQAALSDLRALRQQMKPASEHSATLADLDATISRWQGLHDNADDFSDDPEMDRSEFAVALKHLRAYRAALVASLAPSAPVPAASLAEVPRGVLLEALQRIARAAPDRMDHAVDVAIIERAARIAKEAIALGGVHEKR